MQKTKNAKIMTSILRKFKFRKLKKAILTFIILPIIYNKKYLGLEKSKLCKILSSEGLSFRNGYREPLYYEPIFKKKLGFGRKGWPFSIIKKQASKTL